MRKIILLLIATVPFISYGQNFELGASTGVSMNGKPLGNMFYKAEKAVPNYSFDFCFLSNINNKLQIGLDLAILELSRKPAQNYLNPNKDGNIGNDGKRFVYAKAAYAFCGVINKKIESFNGYFYGGLALGVCLSVNMDKTPNEYASYIAPNGGYGPCSGLQIGYDRYFSQRFAFNAEVAIRNFNLDYDATAPIFKPYSSLHYRIMSYSCNIGVRYALGLKSGGHKEYDQNFF